MRKVNVLILIFTLVSLVLMAFGGCAPSECTLSTSSIPVAGGNINPSSGTYQNGIEVVVTAIPASGYRFDHWEGAASGNSPTLNLKMDSDKNLKAYFKKTYTLTTSCTPANGGTINPNGGAYDEGRELTLVATPAQYYKFDRWGGEVSGTASSVTIRMDSDKTVVASFSKASYSLQTQVDPLGSGTISPSSGTYEGGTQINLVAMPASGYMFDQWSGDISGTSNLSTFPIDANKNITAHFTRAYTLSVSCSPQEGCTVEPVGGSYRAGTQVTLTATTAFPYTFKNWVGTDNNSVNPTTVTMNSDKTIIAYCPQMVASKPVTWNAPLCGGCLVSIPIELNRSEVIQGQIRAGLCDVYVQDPAGVTVKDFGRVNQDNFMFTAQMSGRYAFVINNWNQMYNSAYELTYTIYSVP